MRVLTGDVVNAHAGGVVTGVPEPAGIVEAGEGRLLGDWIRDGVVVCGVPEAGGKGKKGRSANARNRTTTAETFGRHGERRRSAFHAPRAGPATARAAQRRGARRAPARAGHKTVELEWRMRMLRMRRRNPCIHYFFSHISYAAGRPDEHRFGFPQGVFAPIRGRNHSWRL